MGWKTTVRLQDVFHDTNLSFEARRDAIVKRIRFSNWDFHSEDWDAVEEVLDNLAVATDVQQFDAWWTDIYEYADRDRVWIATF